MEFLQVSAINTSYNLSVCVVQELCESRGDRPGLSVLTSLLVSVDVKLYWTILSIGHSLSLICQQTSEEIKQHYLPVCVCKKRASTGFPTVCPVFLPVIAFKNRLGYNTD